jgi:hypothetical protein
MKHIKMKIMEKNNKNKDICQTCEHFRWDFPMPLDRYIPHCEVLDKKTNLIYDTIKGSKSMDEIAEYPCLKCSFDSYLKK